MTKGNEGRLDRPQVGSDKHLDSAYTQHHVDARALSAKLLEERRRQALKLRAEGLTRASIGKIVGAHADTVGRWLKMDIGELAVTPRGRKPGQGLLLTEEQERQITRLVRGKTPDQLAMPYLLWTRHAVQDLIQDTFGIAPALRTVGNYLSRWGAAPDKPQQRAYQQPDSQTQDWLVGSYPTLKSRAKRENAEIYWLGHNRLTHHPGGGAHHRPDSRPLTGADNIWSPAHLLFAITNKGKTRFRFSDDQVDQAALNDLVHRLAGDTRRQIILVMDSLVAPYVHSPDPWLNAHRQVLDVVYLPGSRPANDLHPGSYYHRHASGQEHGAPASATDREPSTAPSAGAAPDRKADA